MNTLQGKVVVVTGAARGLGKAMAGGLVEAGATVIGVDLPREPELEATAREIGERFVPMHADITDASECARIADETEQRFGGAGVLFNNAGVGMQVVRREFAADPLPFWELPVERWRATIETNATTQFLMARALAPGMIARRWGRIVNVTTSYGTMVARGFSPYGPSKAAMEAAAVIWSKDLAGTGVTCNVLIPGGAANTRMISDDRAWPDRQKLVQPAQMIPPAVWLASDAADGVTARRFVAAQWRPDLPASTAAMLASAPAAW